MKVEKRAVRAPAAEFPPAGPMFTRRLVFGYAGTALLVAGLPIIFGAIASAATTLGLDAFTGGLVLGLVFGAATAAVLGLSVRGGRRPTMFVPVGYVLLAGYAAAAGWYVAVRLLPMLIVAPSMRILADIGAVFLVFLIPATIWVWRMVRDPALH